MSPKRLPFDLSIPEPCGEDWQAMRGAGVASRHCDRCQTAVVDVAMLTEAELQDAVERTGGHLCVRLTRFADGTLLLREPPAPLVSVASLLRKPVLAGAVLAGSALGVAAQAPPQVAPPVLSCAEVTALRRPSPDARQDSPVQLSPPAPAPAPQPLRQHATMGMIAPPILPLHGTARLPPGRKVRNGLVYAVDVDGETRQAAIGSDGSFSLALPVGRYRLRAEVRADDGQLYATAEEVLLTRGRSAHDLLLQGPVMVTAGVPAVAPPSSKSH